MISFKHSGNFSKIEKFLKKANSSNYIGILEKYARQGVAALKSATPIDSGKTSDSWDYEIKVDKRGARISWINTNVVNGVPIAILIQYDHGTRNGGFVQGRDYINPALQPIFDKMANEIWEEVTR